LDDLPSTNKTSFQIISSSFSSPQFPLNLVNEVLHYEDLQHTRLPFHMHKTWINIVGYTFCHRGNAYLGFLST
jgi:hypothetical protein